MEAESFYLLRERTDNKEAGWDPMVDEANDGSSSGSAVADQLDQQAAQDACLFEEHGQIELTTFLVANPMRDEAGGLFEQVQERTQHCSLLEGCRGNLLHEEAGDQLSQQFELDGVEPACVDNHVENDGPNRGLLEPSNVPNDGKSGEEHGPSVGDDRVVTDSGIVSDSQLPFTRKIAKPVLGTPPAKPTADKEPVSTQLDSKRKSKRLACKPKSDLTIEQQATALLMKKCGILSESERKRAATIEEFTEQFIGHMENDMVTGYRDLFGLPKEGGADPLGAIAIHAEV